MDYNTFARTHTQPTMRNGYTLVRRMSGEYADIENGYLELGRIALLAHCTGRAKH